MTARISKDKPWSSLLNSIDQQSSTPTKTILLIGSDHTHQQSILSALSQSITLKPSNNTNNASRSATRGIMGYTFLEANEINLNVYSFPDPKYTGVSISNYEKLMHQFSSQSSRNDTQITVVYLVNFLDILSCSKTIDACTNEIAEAVIDNVGSWLKLIHRLFTNDSSLTLSRYKFRKAMYSSFNSGNININQIKSSIDDITLDKGQFDFPINSNLVVSLYNVSTTDYDLNTMKAIDLIQQVLRIGVLKMGGSVFCSSDSSIDTTRIKAFLSLLGFNDISFESNALNGVISVNDTVKASVEEFDKLVIPSGFDTWGKILTLNESVDCKMVDDKWISFLTNYEDSSTSSSTDNRQNLKKNAQSGWTMYQQMLREMVVQG